MSNCNFFFFDFFRYSRNTLPEFASNTKLPFLSEIFVERSRGFCIWRKNISISLQCFFLKPAVHLIFSSLTFSPEFLLEKTFQILPISKSNLVFCIITFKKLEEIVISLELLVQAAFFKQQSFSWRKI